MKLTKLYIHNYKSFYDTTIELDKLNIFVGENNSGKSNLIDVLEFIDIAMSKDIERAIDDKGGYDKIKNYSAVGEEKVVVRATFEDVRFYSPISNDFFIQYPSKSKVTFSFSFFEEYSILSKCFDVNIKYLKIKNHQQKVEIMYKPDEYIDFFNNTSLKCIVSDKQYFDDSSKNRKKIFIASDKVDDIKGKLSSDNLPFSYNFKISTYYFNTDTIRNKSNQDSKHRQLLKDGSNLGKVLFQTKKNMKDIFEIISNSLITNVNEINGIEVEESLGNYNIGFKERNKNPIPIHHVSDGTINFLATMTALKEPNEKVTTKRRKTYFGSLLVFEEPERHLHLNAITYMLEAFRESKKQIIITTHSTEIIKYADLKEIVFIYRDSDGDTQSIRADAIPNLERKMKRLAYERDVTLDELIGEGMIGTFK